MAQSGQEDAQAAAARVGQQEQPQCSLHLAPAAANPKHDAIAKPHLLDVLEPLTPALAAALGQRDRAKLSLICKALYMAMLSAGGWRCTVHEEHLASFGAWLERLQATGGCAGLAVELLGAAASPDDTLTTLRLLAALGPTELAVSGFGHQLDNTQRLQVIRALGTARPCRLRTLRIGIDPSALPALEAITTLQRLECLVWHAPTSHWHWQPHLPQLTALDLTILDPSSKLSLDSLPALRQLALYYNEEDAAIVVGSASLPHLTNLKFNGRELSFPWQRARGLQELALLGDRAGHPSVHGIGQLTALVGLCSLKLPLPLEWLPISIAWLGSVTTLELRFEMPWHAPDALDAREDGINQALHLIAGAPKLVKMRIEDYLASDAHVICKWAWALLGKDSLQSVSVYVLVVDEHMFPGFERSVARQAGEATAAMLGRLALQVGQELHW